MQYKLSKSEWENIGKTNGWLKTAGPGMSAMEQQLNNIAQQIIKRSNSNPQRMEAEIVKMISSNRLDANTAKRLRTLVTQIAQRQSQQARDRWNKVGRPGYQPPAAGAQAPAAAPPAGAAQPAAPQANQAAPR